MENAEYDKDIPIERWISLGKRHQIINDLSLI